MNDLVIVDPGCLGRLPLHQLLVVEPEPDLALPVVRAVAAVDHVASGPQTKVPADGAGRRVLGVGGPQHLTTDGHDVVTLPGHGHHRAGLDVLHQPGEEWTLLNITIIFTVPYNFSFLGSNLNKNILSKITSVRISEARIFQNE